MEIDLIRQECNSTCTLGSLYISGVHFCDTLEGADVQFIRKHPGLIKPLTNSMRCNAPPLGSYTLDLVWHEIERRMLPHLQNVKYHPFCYIHKGYTWLDCNEGIIIGQWRESWQIMSHSNKYLDMLCAKIREQEIKNNHQIIINIQWQQ